MIAINPASTRDEVATRVDALSDAGFAATYVFTAGIDEPARAVELIAGVAALAR